MHTDPSLAHTQLKPIQIVQNITPPPSIYLFLLLPRTIAEYISIPMTTRPLIQATQLYILYTI